MVVAHRYEDIISLENLLNAWREFLNGKRKKADVQEFGRRLMNNLLDLHCDLENKTYRHGGYQAFRINDPKPRQIHKASVRDRLLHHAIHRVLEPYLDMSFIVDSYSSRKGKGVHKALNRFRLFGRQVSRNNTGTCWVLKCDIRKFFASIDQKILLKILKKHITEANTLDLITRVVQSFSSAEQGKGLPLGNLTSQLLVNVYMNQFDHFVTERLKAKHYIRYADDFVIFSENRKWLEQILPAIDSYLRHQLNLELHPNKVYIATLASGVDFLGWVHFPDHRVLRTTTKKRMFRRIEGLDEKSPSVQSYLGVLGHGNGKKLKNKILTMLK